MFKQQEPFDIVSHTFIIHTNVMMFLSVDMWFWTPKKNLNTLIEWILQREYSFVYTCHLRFDVTL